MTQSLMDIELTRISFEADVYDVRKAVAVVIQAPISSTPMTSYSPCWLKPGTPTTTQVDSGLK